MPASFDFWARGSPLASGPGIGSFDAWARSTPLDVLDPAPEYDASAFPIEDSFTDTAGTDLDDHQGEAGAEWSKLSPFAQTAEISDANRARAASGGGSADVFYYASGDPPTDEYYVEAVFKFKSLGASDGSLYIVARLDTGSTDGYYGGYSLSDGLWYFWADVNGVYTQFGTWAESISDEATRTVRLSIRDSRKALIVDGVERISTTNNAETQIGKVGAFWSAAQTDSTGVHLESLEADEIENYVLVPNDLAQSQALEAATSAIVLPPNDIAQSQTLQATTLPQNYTFTPNALAQGQGLEPSAFLGTGVSDRFDAWRRSSPLAGVADPGIFDAWRRGAPLAVMGKPGEGGRFPAETIEQAHSLTAPTVAQNHVLTPDAVAQGHALSAASMVLETGIPDAFDAWSRGALVAGTPDAGRFDHFRRSTPIFYHATPRIPAAVFAAGSFGHAHTLEATTLSLVVSTILEVDLGGYSDYEPSTLEDHFLRYQYGKSAAGGERVDLLVRLMEAGVTIAQWSHLDITEAVVEVENELLTSQTALIDDYSQLYVQFEFLYHQNGAEREGRIYWLEFEAPDPAPVTFSPANIGQAHTLATTSASSVYVFSPADLTHAATLESTYSGDVNPVGVTQDHFLFSPIVSQNHVLVPTSITQAQGVETAFFVVPADLVLVNGREVRVYEDPPLEISDLVEERSTASFIVRDDDGDLVFERGERVIVLDGEGERAFAGYIDTVTEERINAFGAKRHVIRCIDNHYKADKRRVAKSYTNETVEDIVADLITTYLEDEGVLLATAEIDPGPTIGEAVFAYRPVSEVLDRLADLAGFWWRIDHDDVLRFRERAAEPAPWTLTGADIIGRPSYERANPLYRNRQYIRGGRDLTDPQTFGPVAGDSETRQWTMGFPLAKVPTVEVNGVEATVDLKMFADSHSADFYWQKGDPVIVQDSGATVLGVGDDIEVTYQGEFNIIAVSEDTAEVERRKLVEGGGSGIVESVDDDASIASRVAALGKAAALLAKYGIEGEQLEVVTLRSGLRPGMEQTVLLPDHALDNDELLITEITTQRIRTSTGFVYLRRVREILGPSLGSWARFFLKISRPPSFVDRLSVGEDSVLTLLHSFTEDFGAEEDVAFSANACEFPAEDLYPATDFYPC